MKNNTKNSKLLIENYQYYLSGLYPELDELIREDKQWKLENGYKFTEHSFFSNLTDYTKDLIQQKKSDDVKHLMEIAEILLEYGSENLYNAVATCYIENLVNTAFNSPDRVSFDSFVPYLGPKSKEYCRYWDKFMGGPKTPGVY